MLWGLLLLKEGGFHDGFLSIRRLGSSEPTRFHILTNFSSTKKDRSAIHSQETLTTVYETCSWHVTSAIVIKALNREPSDCSQKPWSC
ncbi:hypothetical protein TREES_T100015832 [Tupaia chinensis]|uniref:Uncharacterized protein n=1 Tax=Tupaia chinensis TaxID=246437 RepID=L9L3Y4_TUPCH|nr:hypothetical protein TREES_T100015832 [Tupaia chinensis]